MKAILYIFVLLGSAESAPAAATVDGECASDDAAALLQVSKWTPVMPVELRDRTDSRARANRHTVFACGGNRDGVLGQGKDVFALRRSSTPLRVKDLEAFTIVQVAGKELNKYFRTSDGLVLGTGDNGNGDLGLGRGVIEANSATVIPGAFDVKDVLAGEEHVLFVHNDGTVSGTGRNYDSQISDDGATVFRVTHVKGVKDVATGAAGHRHNLLVLKDGKVAVNGRNLHGALGLGISNTTIVIFPPKINWKVRDFGPASGAAAGNFHSLVLLRNGKVLAFGRQNRGQLCNGVVSFEDQDSPILIPGLEDIVHVAAGRESSYFVTRSGDVFACGNNLQARLGVDTFDTVVPKPHRVFLPGKAVKVVGGQVAAYFLLADGRVFAAGINRNGELCNGNFKSTNGTHPVQVRVGGAIDIASGIDALNVAILAKKGH